MLLQLFKTIIRKYTSSTHIYVYEKGQFHSKKLSEASHGYILAVSFVLLLFLFIFANYFSPALKIVSPLVSMIVPLEPLKEGKGGKEVFGFAPYWKIDSLDNVDFDVLTTFGYFGIDINTDGTLDRQSVGYDVFRSRKATDLFSKAHKSGTRVVLTITQMKNETIEAFLGDPNAQRVAVNEVVAEVKNRGIDGVNVDFEYLGNPGPYYRQQYNIFIQALTNKMHESIPASRVTVAVYAAAAKEPKLYDVTTLAQNSDGLFMMAYDFATSSADNAMPTAPLYGYSKGKYWYDVSTAVDDFLKLIPSNKLILGVPYYGYNYLVYTPKVNASTLPYWTWKGKPMAQEYSDIVPASSNMSNYKEGWDEDAEVAYKAYYDPNTEVWRMIFYENVRSLGIKYDFAKNKNLAGVGIWALGFDQGKTELWDLLSEKFGAKHLVDSSAISQRMIREDYNYE